MRGHAAGTLFFEPALDACGRSIGERELAVSACARGGPAVKLPGNPTAPMLSPIETARRKLTVLTDRIFALPVLVLMPHSRCNCRCVMCDIWRANAAKKEISRSDLERHLVAIRRLGVRSVVFSGGEALMHSNLFELCEGLSGLGVQITLLSTGLLLERFAPQVVRWCRDVIVSLDGSPAVHDEIRAVPRAYARLSEGVRALRALDPKYPVTGRCVIQRRNYFDLSRVIESAKEVGLDQISFLAVDVSTRAFNRPSSWTSDRIDDAALSRDEVDRFRRVVEETIEGHTHEVVSGFVAENPRALRRLPQYFAALNGDCDFPEVHCNAPWVSAVVEADGLVRPCFFHEAVGSINDGPLDAVLNSSKALAFRRELDVQTNEICRKCVCSLYLPATKPV